MAFNIWMWILLALIIIVTIAIILILTVGSVLEERSYDHRSETEKRQNTEKNLEMANDHTDEDDEVDSIVNNQPKEMKSHIKKKNLQDAHSHDYHVTHDDSR